MRKCHIYYVEVCAKAELVLIKIHFKPQMSKMEKYLNFNSGSFEFLENKDVKISIFPGSYVK